MYIQGKRNNLYYLYYLLRGIIAMYKILEYNDICNMFGTNLKIIYLEYCHHIPRRLTSTTSSNLFNANLSELTRIGETRYVSNSLSLTKVV